MKKLCQASTLAFLLLLTCADRGLATCGDDVDGARVPCECGDVVVSDTRLRPGDPVVSGRCLTDGLLVRARPGAESISLDLGGLSLLGSGRGTGIYVINGGKLGATVVGGDAGQRGEVAGFGTGFRARGQRSVRELRAVAFSGNARDGVVLRGASTNVVDVKAERNGGDGFRIGGRSPNLEGVEAQQNGGSGVRVTSPGARLGEVVADGNGRAQMRVNKNAAAKGDSR